MGARVGIVVFVVDLDLRGATATAAASRCEVGRVLGAASSLPGQMQRRRTKGQGRVADLRPEAEGRGGF